MSSMIPIFIMPIAVLDAVHILSDFYDRYPEYNARHAELKNLNALAQKQKIPVATAAYRLMAKPLSR